MANPSVNPSGYAIDGLWLHPFRGNGIVTEHMAWVGSNSPALRAEMSSEVITISSRREKVSQDGVLHLDEGSVSGLLIDRHGKTATEWMRRLNYLAVHQRDFRGIVLITNYYLFPIQIRDLDKAKVPSGWEVSFSFREVATDVPNAPIHLPHRWLGWEV